MDPQQPVIRHSLVGDLDFEDDLSGLDSAKAAAAATEALAWLDQNPANFRTGSVLWRLLERNDLEADVAVDVMARAFAWLDQNPDAIMTVTVIVALLRWDDRDPAISADAVTCAFAWLDQKGTTKEGYRILRQLLQQSDLDPAISADAVTCAFAWLDQNETDKETGSILSEIISRTDLTSVQTNEAAMRAESWVKKYPKADYAKLLRILLDGQAGVPVPGAGPEKLEGSASPDAQDDDDQTDLLFRVYIPSERLYAAEADRLLSLFRDWLITTRGRGIRQAGYSTASGKMYEFFADSSVIPSDVQREFDSFSSFLTLCVTDTSAAADMLIPLGLGRVVSAEFVAQVSREVRQLQTDLTHERERRIMIIRHSIEKELVDDGSELRSIPRAVIQAVIESLVPGPTAPDSLALLAAPQPAQMAGPLTVNINPQIISAMESTIIHSVRGSVQLGPQAKQLLELIDQFGGHQQRELESAVYELEDADAPVVARSAAKRRLKTFLGQITGSVREVALELLQKYIEDKLGL